MTQGKSGFARWIFFLVVAILSSQAHAQSIQMTGRPAACVSEDYALADLSYRLRAGERPGEVIFQPHELDDPAYQGGDWVKMRFVSSVKREREGGLIRRWHVEFHYMLHSSGAVAQLKFHNTIVQGCEGEIVRVSSPAQLNQELPYAGGSIIVRGHYEYLDYYQRVTIGDSSGPWVYLHTVSRFIIDSVEVVYPVTNVHMN